MDSPETSKSTNLCPDPDPSRSKTNVSIAVLMGLPASGKSTLAKKLQDFCSAWKTVVISFDYFIPLSIQGQIIQHLVQDSSENLGLHSGLDASEAEPNLKNGAAKILRKKFVACVEMLIQLAKEVSDDLMFSKSKHIEILKCNLSSLGSRNLVSDDDLVSKTELISEKILKLLKLPGQTSPGQKLLILVDDNNYYHSMRNDFYQIAKQSETGYSLIYCKAPLKACVERNSARDAEAQVPSKAIVEMSLKLEEPHPLQNPCDICCIQVNTISIPPIPTNVTDVSKSIAVESEANDFEYSVNLPLLEQVIDRTFQIPLKRNEDRTEEIERDRRICSENEVHQADIILRKWINKRLNLDCLARGLNKGVKSESSSSFKKNLSSDLNSRKKKTLEKLKSGEFKVSFSVSEDVEFREEIIQMFQNISL